MSKYISSLLFVIVSSISLTACGSDTPSTPVTPKKERDSLPATPPDSGSSGNQNEICSALEFSNVSWPSHYTVLDKVAFSVGMNITGSFEGHSGWTNISNNFDGQGVSLGILNQNLGSGTLQPLLVKMRDHHKVVLEKYLSQEMLDSLLDMLAEWESLQWQNLFEWPVEPVRQRVLNLDPNIDKKYGDFTPSNRSTSGSVKWAVRTLYTDSKGRNFKTFWKDALKNIAGDPAYVSLQIEEAQYIHERAMEYRNRVGWGELRSYLFLFDIVVQNGSLKDKHFEKYEQWLSKKDDTTEEEQMLEMLEIRVVDSLKEWQDDVRSRKTTIIKGEGFVHGEQRNLPVEYCYDPQLPY